MTRAGRWRDWTGAECQRLRELVEREALSNAACARVLGRPAQQVALQVRGMRLRPGCRHDPARAAVVTVVASGEDWHD